MQLQPKSGTTRRAKFVYLADQSFQSLDLEGVKQNMRRTGGEGEGGDDDDVVDVKPTTTPNKEKETATEKTATTAAAAAQKKKKQKKQKQKQKQQPLAMKAKLKRHTRSRGGRGDSTFNSLGISAPASSSSPPSSSSLASSAALSSSTTSEKAGTDSRAEVKRRRRSSRATSVALTKDSKKEMEKEKEIEEDCGAVSAVAAAPKKSLKSKSNATKLKRSSVFNYVYRSTSCTYFLVYIQFMTAYSTFLMLLLNDYFPCSFRFNFRSYPVGQKVESPFCREF